MNSANLLGQDKTKIASTHKALMASLKRLGDARGVALEARTPSLVTPPKPVPVHLLGALHTANKHAAGLFCLGFPDEASIGKFKELFGKANPQPEEKPAEHDVMMDFFRMIEAELKSQGDSLDPKRSLILLDASLGAWKCFESETQMLLPVGTPAGDLTFVLPLFDTAFFDRKTEEFYGFPRSSRIMVVDGSATSRMSSRQHLAMAGYFNVDETTDGKAALQKLQNSRPTFGLVVADWHMPVMSGFDLLKQVRALPDIKTIPVILAAGEKSKEEIVAAVKERVTGYLIKPLEPTSFFKSLKMAGASLKK